jgi:hypothetical protein
MICVVLTISNSCKKDEVAGPVPVLTTSAITNVAYSTANCGGTITSDGGLAVIVKGVCWSIGQTPTIANDKTSDGAGGGTFVSAIKGLSANTTYFVRAYAINNNGTGYGMTLSFTTKQALIPILTTDTVGNITQTSANCGGNITQDYGSPVTSRGVCWSTNPTPTLTDSKTTDGSGTGIFSSSITGLTVNTTYYVRSYATNSSGTGYGNARSFITKQDYTTLPVLNTTAVTDITKYTAKSGGTITSEGGTPVTNRGVCWVIGQTPTILDSKSTDGSGSGTYISDIVNLLANTKYNVRAYATNSAGTAYGNIETFTSQLPTIPDINTTVINNITLTTCNTGGTIVSDGASPITAKGVCYSTSPNPTIASAKTNDGTGPDDFTSNLTGLTRNTTYYVKAYATNSVGTAYGIEKNFTTLSGNISLNTISVSSIKITSAETGGFISDDGGASVTARGVCYSTIPNPTISDSKTNDGSGTGSFTSSLTGLSVNTIYYIRSYASNSVGTFYGNEISFTTQNGNITLSTTSASSIKSTSASSGGNITDDGGTPIVDRGVCYSISSNPTTSDSKTSDGNGNGTFSSLITGLSPGTKYYLRAYATNSISTNYGNEITITTPYYDIGQSYGGGIIFYIDGTGQHGLIAAPSDQSTGIQWYNGTNTLTYATATAIGTGNANTNTIVSNQGAGNYAAKLCYDLVLGGYSDWYLPSKDELVLLYLNKVIIGSFAINNYWSSSEANYTEAWSLYTGSGSQANYFKYGTFYVRAIRSF